MFSNSTERWVFSQWGKKKLKCFPKGHSVPQKEQCPPRWSTPTAEPPSTPCRPLVSPAHAGYHAPGRPHAPQEREPGLLLRASVPHSKPLLVLGLGEENLILGVLRLQRTHWKELRVHENLACGQGPCHLFWQTGKFICCEETILW